jgi:hypothetical protein
MCSLFNVKRDNKIIRCDKLGGTGNNTTIAYFIARIRDFLKYLKTKEHFQLIISQKFEVGSSFIMTSPSLLLQLTCHNSVRHSSNDPSSVISLRYFNYRSSSNTRLASQPSHETAFPTGTQQTTQTTLDIWWDTLRKHRWMSSKITAIRDSTLANRKRWIDVFWLLMKVQKNYRCHGHIVDKRDTYVDDDMGDMCKEAAVYFPKYFPCN